MTRWGEDHMGQCLAGEFKTTVFILSAMGAIEWLHAENSDDYSGCTGKDGWEGGQSGQY